MAQSESEGNAFIDTERSLILEAMRAANKLDFKECFEFLDQAQRLAVERRKSTGKARPDEAAAMHATEQALGFFRTCYEAMKYRVERNPGKALNTYELARTKGAKLAKDRLASPILRLVEAQQTILPVQSQLSEAVECLFKADFHAARRNIQSAEALLISALRTIAIDVERSKIWWQQYILQATLPALSQEKIVGVLGVCADFVVASSVIKLQYCILTQNYHDEIERFKWIKNVFDIFELYTRWTSAVLLDTKVEHLRKIMTICNSFAAACTALVEGGHAASQGDFVTAHDLAQLAKSHLIETSREVRNSDINHAPIFESAVLNIQLFAIPPMESRWEQQKLKDREIADLKESHRRRIEEIEAKVEESHRALLDMFKMVSSGLAVNVTNKNEITTIEMPSQHYDHVLDELKDILQQIQVTGTAVDANAINKTMHKIGAARATKNPEQKLAKVKTIVGDMGAIVDSVANAAPRITDAFSTIAKLFGF